MRDILGKKLNFHLFSIIFYHYNFNSRRQKDLKSETHGVFRNQKLMRGLSASQRLQQRKKVKRNEHRTKVLK